MPLRWQGHDQLMVGVSCQDDIFVGKRVTPLLHLQWTASVDIHLVVLGGAPWWATVVTPQGVFAEAQIRVLLVGICRFATATALLLLWGSRQVPSSFLDPQERESCQVETRCLGIRAGTLPAPLFLHST